MLANLNESLDEDQLISDLKDGMGKSSKIQSQNLCDKMDRDDRDKVFNSSSKNSQTTHNSKNKQLQQQKPLTNTSKEIAMISTEYDEQSPTQISVIQDEEDITCIPSTDKIGIPLSFKTDVSSLTSMISKDPSPIIKTNFFKLPTDVIKSIKLNLNPEVREISPAVSEDKNTTGEVSSGEMSSGGNYAGDNPGGYNWKDDVLVDDFEDQMLKEAQKMKKNQKKYNSRKVSKSGKEKKTAQSKENFERLEKLQESFDQINQSTVFEVAVTKDSDCKLMLVEEEPSRKKEDKVWLEGSDSGSSYSAKDTGMNVSFGKAIIGKQITTIAPLQVTNNDISVQFNEVSNCMVTEADSTGLLMDIEEFNTPPPDTVRAEETESMFSKILEESRLAGSIFKTNTPSNLVSTPTKCKLSHIREAEMANMSPFQQFLEKVGGVKSPIQSNDYFWDGEQDKQPKSRMVSRNDSGFETLGQISANLSLPSFSAAEQKFSKRPRLTPSQCFSQSFCGSPPQTKQKKTLAARSPGKQELEDYYKMLCKTPGRVSPQSTACSSQPLLDDLALKSQDYQLAEIRLSPLVEDRSSPKPTSG